MGVWDPIGVSDEPQAADEYDAYLGQIAKRLREGAKAEEFARFLSGLADGMGLQQAEYDDLMAARRMRGWYDVSTSHFARPS
jgi:hypothetical protein